ncbi:MAG: hypothetical protein NTX59_03295 [Elusimicrobia bacterium]|nr:hypothetical protein [Elusimicrobiota bacterium]
MIEIIGYLASALIAVSLLTSNVWRLRLLNFLGAAIFSLYGFLAGAWPVLTVNLFIAGVDLYYLIQLRARKDIFQLMDVPPSDRLLENFLAYHAKDIWAFFPDFSLKAVENPRCVFILRNLLPVGLFIYTVETPDIRVHLDYVVEDYRDLKSARYLFNRPQNAETFRGYAAFTALSGSLKHSAYMRRVGFEEDPLKKGFFRKKI